MALDSCKDSPRQEKPAIPGTRFDKDDDDDDQEEELFEINLEAVNNIPPPHYWEGYVTASGAVLLANCLLPVADVLSAVPTKSAVFDDVSIGKEYLEAFVFQA